MKAMMRYMAGALGAAAFLAFAGPEGAIITEVANVHSNDGVRHLDPVINNTFLGKK